MRGSTSVSTSKINFVQPQLCCHCGENPSEFHNGKIEQFVEAEDAAPFLKMSAEYLKKLARAGEIPAHPRGDGQRRRWLFLISELAQWMKSRVNSANAPCTEKRF